MRRLSTLWKLIRAAGEGWVDHKASRMAAALAYYSILSMAPLLILAVSVAGLVFGEEAARGELMHQLKDMVGEAGAKVIQDTLAAASKPSSGILATVIGVVTLLFGASGVFAELQDSMNSVWGVQPKPGRGVMGIVRDRFLSFGMVLVIGFLLLISLVVNTVLSALGKYMSGFAPGVPELMAVVNLGVSLLIITGLFAAIFKVLPDVQLSWRSALIGAGVTAALFTLGKYLIGLYLARAGVETPFGAAGSLVALVVWVYYSALILFFGAEITRVYAVKFDAVEPSSNAEPLPGSDLANPEPAEPLTAL